jgi:hypothetical protein
MTFTGPPTRVRYFNRSTLNLKMVYLILTWLQGPGSFYLTSTISLRKPMVLMLVSRWPRCQPSRLVRFAKDKGRRSKWQEKTVYTPMRSQEKREKSLIWLQLERHSIGSKSTNF